jgi:osmotically inducible protein OsmC
MKFTRQANAKWIGPGKDGKGALTTQSGVLKNTQYSYKTRFENSIGTNPEELIGAAHSGCFTMQLSFLLGEAGFTPDVLDTSTKVTFEDGDVTQILLELGGKVPGIEDSEFQNIAKKAKETCPISKLLKAEITLVATLIK